MAEQLKRLVRSRGARTTLAVIAVATGVPITYGHVRSRWNRLGSQSVAENQAASIGASSGTIQTDVLVVGSGGAALLAALRAKSLGLDVLVVEKSAKLGGTSNYSGGALWIPNNHIHAAANDSPQEALAYMESIIGDAGPASSRERKEAFLENGPKMVRFMQEQGYRWTATPRYPDYFPYNPGAKIGGRTIEPGLFDLHLLGPWRRLLNINPVRPPIPLYTFELSKIVRFKCSWDGWMTAAKIFGSRQFVHRVMGEEVVTLGVSMISQLLYMNVRLGVPIMAETPMKELFLDGKGERVAGAIVERDGKRIRIEASRGVVLAAGGFARNEKMRKEHQAPEITALWTSTTPTDEGDAISAAMNVGAATALMDSAWWGAALYDPVAKHGIWCLYDRGLPHSLIVDQSARRYANESQNYNSIGREIWERQKAGYPAVPSYLIMDSTHRSRYLLAGRFLPGANGIPQDAYDSGFVTKAQSMDEMAQKLGLDAKTLEATVERFNGFVAKGVDEDFKRGSSVYDGYLGDPAYAPNRNLGAVAKAPFYAMKIWPGDLGTKGGVLTDERARALRESKSRPGTYEVIKGLYAVGNSSASVMGRTYAGAGATLGPALTFAYVAVNDLAGISA